MIKISRNELYHCGSRLKYKKCCLKNDKDKISGQNLQSKIERSDRLTQRLGTLDRKISMVGLPLGETKMDEIILELAANLLQHARTDYAVHTVIGLACCAWNLALLDEATREENIKIVSNELGGKTKLTREEVSSTISGLIQRKLTHYPNVNCYICDYQLIWSEKNFHLNIVSSILNLTVH